VRWTYISFAFLFAAVSNILSTPASGLVTVDSFETPSKTTRNHLAAHYFRTIGFLAALVMVVVATLLAGPSWGAVFSCDEAGLDAAIAAAEDAISPDPGPHTFNCAGPTVIPVTGSKFVSADITIDGGGLVTFDGGNTT
jgi:hypothetical protein